MLKKCKFKWDVLTSLGFQMLPSPSPSSSGQLSQLGASLYGPQSEYKSSVWLIVLKNRCDANRNTMCSDSEHQLISDSFPAYFVGALGFSIRGLSNNNPQLNRSLSQGTQLPSHSTPTTGVSTMSLHTPPSPNRYAISSAWLMLIYDVVC